MSLFKDVHETALELEAQACICMDCKCDMVIRHTQRWIRRSKSKVYRDERGSSLIAVTRRVVGSPPSSCGSVRRSVVAATQASVR